MRHPDEHTLELYVLAAGEIAGKRREIERHLKACARCRNLHEGLKELYAGISLEIDENHHLGQRESKAIVRRTSMSMDYPLGDSTTRYYEPLTRIERFRRFVGRNAVAASIGAAAVFGVLLFALISGRMQRGDRRSTTDTNPAYVLLNGDSQALEVYNESNEKLWSVPISAAGDYYRSDRIRNVHSVIVTDLNGDGQNEVVSLLPDHGNYGSHSVTVYGPHGRVLKNIRLTIHSVSFRNKKYESAFQPGAVTSVRKPDGGNELMVAWGNGRSPSVITRIRPDGTIAGEYWHYGNFMGMYYLAGSDTAQDRVVCIGCDDIAEQDGLNHQFIVSLDPWRTVGKTECTWNRGFGLPPSDAEIDAVVFDHNELERITHRTIYLSKLISTGENVLRFSFNSGSDLEDPPSLEYVFSRDFRLLDIKNEDKSVRMIEKLHKEGKADFVLNAAYLNDLKHRVLFWDGTRWQHKPTEVKHNE